MNEEVKNKNIKVDKSINILVIATVTIMISTICIGMAIYAYCRQNESTFKELKGTPTEIVLAAISNRSIESLQKREKVEEKTGIAQIKRTLESEANEIKFNVGLQAVSDIEKADIISAYIKDAGLSGTFQSTKEADKVNGNLQITQSGLELLRASLYKDKNEVGISIPKILDAPYGVKLTTLVEDYKNSALMNLIGEDAISEEKLEDMRDILSVLGEYIKGTMNLSTNEAFRNQVKSLNNEFIKELSLKKDGKEKLTLIEGSERDCTVYRGSLSSKQLKEYIHGQIDIFMELEFVKNYFSIILEQSDRTVDEMIAELEEAVDLNEKDTIDIKIFVDDTFFRRLEVTILEDTMKKANFSIEYIGKDSLSDGIVIKVNEPDKKENMEIRLTQNLGENDEAYAQHLDFSLVSQGETISTLSYDYKYDAKVKTDNVNVSLGMEFDKMDKVFITASGTKLINMEDVSINFAKAHLSSQFGEKRFGLDFNFGYGIKPIKASEIRIDKTGVKYILDMDETELVGALQAIRSNIQAFTYGLLFA